ncbi:MAG TPA: serine hydrolase [Pseudosphingobacterium sp.]|nr:serine hydrolase [Pseudosphingobacterium sp.]
MKGKFTSIILYYLMSLGLSSVSAQNVQKRLDSLFFILSTGKSFNGNVLVAEQNKILYKKSVGYANIAKATPNNDSTTFQIGSLSKTFTALAILQLWEKKKIPLDAPYQKYVRDFPYSDITIYQLLSHTTGLPDKEQLFFPLIDAHPDEQFDNNDILSAIKAANIPLAFQPGTEWRYNNIGYALLALLVEKLTAQKFADYLQTYIFQPANMKDTFLLSQDRTKDSRQATGYLIRAHYMGDLESIADSKKVRRWSYNMRGFNGPTNIISTSSDLLNFDQALYDGKLVKPQTLQKAFEPTRLKGKMVSNEGEFGRSSYGLGWELPSDTTIGRLVMHTGREPGFFTFFIRDLTHKRTIIVMDNTEGREFGKACKETFNIVSGTNFFPIHKQKSSLFLSYAKTLYEKGSDQAITFFNLHRFDTANYFMDERELNELGLELLNDSCYKEALDALKLCTILYPDSWNTYDSYGKALYKSGQIREAISMYQKSISMNPQNEPGKEMLSMIKREYPNITAGL